MRQEEKQDCGAGYIARGESRTCESRVQEQGQAINKDLGVLSTYHKNKRKSWSWMRTPGNNVEKCDSVVVLKVWFRDPVGAQDLSRGQKGEKHFHK